MRRQTRTCRRIYFDNWQEEKEVLACENYLAHVIVKNDDYFR